MSWLARNFRLLLSATVFVGCWMLVEASARASCASTVVVDGRILWGIAPDTDRYGNSTLAANLGLPPRTGRRDAIAPGCDDGDGGGDDQRITVLTLKGVPAKVAVVDEAVTTLYVARSSLTISAAHPLHEVLHSEHTPYRDCRPDQARI